MGGKSARPNPLSILRPFPARTHRNLVHAPQSRRSHNHNQENHQLLDTKTLPSRRPPTQFRKLPVLVQTRTFSAINSHPSTRSQVVSSSNSNSSSNIGSLSPCKACRTHTWRTCSRPTRSITWTPRPTSSGSNNTTCRPHRTKSSSSIFNNNSRHVSSMHRRVLTVPWATRTRTGTGSFSREIVLFMISFCFFYSRLPDRPCIHANAASLSLRALILFILAFDSVVQHKQHMIPCNV
jgi:hypothetical protein